MTALEWDKVGERFYRTGVDKGVLYLESKGTYPKGVAWSGLTAVNEKPSGADEQKKFADNVKYLGIRGAEEFGASIECFYYPKEFEACDGSATLVEGVTVTGQTRSRFGFAYRTLLGNDEKGTDYGYEIHLIYGATASPSQVNNQTINDTPDAATISYEITTTPVAVTGMKPTAHVVINSTKVNKEKLAAFEKIIYGSEDGEARLPLPDEVKTLLTQG